MMQTDTHNSICQKHQQCVYFQTHRQLPSLVSISINHFEQVFPWSLLSPQADTTTSGWQGLEWHWDTIIRYHSKLPLFYELSSQWFSIIFVLLYTNYVCGMGWTPLYSIQAQEACVVVKYLIFWTALQSTPNELGKLQVFYPFILIFFLIFIFFLRERERETWHLNFHTRLFQSFLCLTMIFLKIHLPCIWVDENLVRRKINVWKWVWENMGQVWNLRELFILQKKKKKRRGK